jgi:hypothetical protein
MEAVHPIAQLRAALAVQFADDLPVGVHPVEQWCAEPQFFPGATGLLSNSSWLDVAPGSAGLAVGLPPAPERGVLVLGNYQATRSSYQRILDGDIGGFPTTWRVLGQLLASIPPTQVFLTNAFIGLPDLDSDTAPFPTTPSFTRRCEQLLTKEVELFRPRLVVCLGVPAAKRLAAITPALGLWRRWPGYAALERHAGRRVDGCTIARVGFTAVAVRHPSAVVSRHERHRDTALVESAAQRFGFHRPEAGHHARDDN